MAKIKINRAPVLTLWASVVAERLGYKRDEALALAKALTGLSAQAHGRAIGIYEPAQKSKTKKAKEPKPIKIVTVEFLGRKIPVTRTKEGIRAVSKDSPIKPESVEKYLESKFGDSLADARDTMEKLARSLPPKELSDNAYKLYGRFTPQVPAGTRGWGAKGELDLDVIRSLVGK